MGSCVLIVLVQNFGCIRRPLIRLLEESCQAIKPHFVLFLGRVYFLSCSLDARSIKHHMLCNGLNQGTKRKWMLLTRASYSVNDGDLSREGIPFIDHFIRSFQLKV